MKYEELYIVRYLNGERNFRREITVYDHYRTEEVFGDKEAMSICKLYADQIAKTNKAFTGYAFNDYVFDITTIQFDLKNLGQQLSRLANELIIQSENVGGDDDSYDYFPDLVFAFQQVCEHFDKKELFNETADLVNANLPQEDKYDIDALVEHI